MEPTFVSHCGTIPNWARQVCSDQLVSSSPRTNEPCVEGRLPYNLGYLEALWMEEAFHLVPSTPAGRGETETLRILSKLQIFASYLKLHGATLPFDGLTTGETNSSRRGHCDTLRLSSLPIDQVQV